MFFDSLLQIFLNCVFSPPLLTWLWFPMKTRLAVGGGVLLASGPGRRRDALAATSEKLRRRRDTTACGSKTAAAADGRAKWQHFRNQRRWPANLHCSLILHTARLPGGREEEKISPPPPAL